MSFEDDLIQDMRAHGGEATTGPLAGHPLLILTSIGRRSGEPRRSILTWSRDGGDFIVAGTAGGSRTDPAWIANVAAHPDVTVEQGNRTFAATGEPVPDGPERDRLWEQHVAQLPWFADYPAQAGRTIPLVRIKPTA